jgi:hypothetical protein
MTFEHDRAHHQQLEDAELQEALRLSEMDSRPHHSYADYIPSNAASEQEMLERALAESLKNSAAAPAASEPPQEVATLPPRKNPSPPPPPPEEVLKQVQELPIITDREIAALQVTFMPLRFLNYLLGHSQP